MCRSATGMPTIRGVCVWRSSASDTQSNTQSLDDRTAAKGQRVLRAHLEQDHLLEASAASGVTVASTPLQGALVGVVLLQHGGPQLPRRRRIGHRCVRHRRARRQAHGLLERLQAARMPGALHSTGDQMEAQYSRRFQTWSCAHMPHANKAWAATSGVSYGERSMHSTGACLLPLHWPPSRVATLPAQHPQHLPLSVVSAGHACVCICRHSAQARRVAWGRTMKPGGVECGRMGRLNAVWSLLTSEW